MEDKAKSRVTVYIMGEEYVLKSKSSAERMHSVGRYVDRMMRYLAENNHQMSRQKIAILAALNLADELLKLKEEKLQSPGEANKRGDNNDLV